MNKIVLGTSVSPRNIEKQIYAIRTWIENGFRVISCNVKSEIDVLKPLFEDVAIEFVEVERDASDIAGKALPYIQDILSIVGERTEKICGCINSDIVMPVIDKGLYQYICDETVDALVYTHRYEIKDYNDIDAMNWEIYINGIDLFFVDKKIIKDFFDDGFFVQSTWDLGIMAKCRMLGIRIKELINPIAFHVSHSVSWNFKAYNIPLKSFWNKYSPECKNINEEALNCYYETIASKSEKICYLRQESDKCLFVIESIENNKETIACIEKQDYPYVHISNTDEKKYMYDIVIYIKNNILLDKVFCRSVIYLMQKYNCRKLWMGRFMTSEINGKKMYNEISKNMQLLMDINRCCELGILVQQTKCEGIEREVYIPTLEEYINIFDKNIVDQFELFGKLYIMPQGIRAIERFHVYKDKVRQGMIEGFIDNDVNKWGKSDTGLFTYSLQKVHENNNDYLVIIASKYYYKEIEEQLCKLEKKPKMLNSYFILWIDDEQKCYYFNYNKYIKLHNEKNRGNSLK